MVRRLGVRAHPYARLVQKAPFAAAGAKELLRKGCGIVPPGRASNRRHIDGLGLVSTIDFDMAAPILVVDDDPKIVSLVKTYLEREGLRVVTAPDGQAALRAFNELHPGLIVLDLMLPELDGLALMRIIRERSDVPIVMLSARAQVGDRVYGIHEGADDYLAKPFSPAELVGRVKAVLRRTERSAERPKDRGTLQHGDLAIDLDRLEVRRDRRLISLTAAEFRLLTALIQAEG